MKHIFIIIPLFLLSVSCGTRQKEIPLPELGEKEQNVFENEVCRIVDEEDTDAMENVLKVQPKREGYASFELTMKDNYAAFEEADDTFLLVSFGTGNVRDLNVYDLKTGKTRLEVKDFLWGVEKSNEKGVYYVCLYGEDIPPSVYWDKATKTWKSDQEIPEHYFNSQFEQVKKEHEALDHLADGFPLVCFEKYKIDANQQTLTPTGEYQWNYAE